MGKSSKKHIGLDYIFFYAMLLIGAVVGIVIFLTKADTTPATALDYEPLYEQVDELRSDFSSVGDMENVTFYSPNKGKLVLDGGKECDLAVYYDPDTFEITNTVEIDKVLNTSQYIALLILTVLPAIGVGALIACAVFICEIVADKIKSRKKKEYY